jgi:hypothetical protein
MPRNEQSLANGKQRIAPGEQIKLFPVVENTIEDWHAAERDVAETHIRAASH